MARGSPLPLREKVTFPEKNNTVTSGQWRMIGSGIAFVMLVILLLTKYLVTDNPWIIGAIGISGVLLGGIKMFSKAWASVNNAIMICINCSGVPTRRHA